MHVVIIGGASRIGSTVGYTLSGMDPDVEVTLVDIDEDAAWAHATDISHAKYHFSGTLERVSNSATDVGGAVRSTTPAGLEGLDPDLLVFNAAAPRPEEATDRGAREAELDRNLEIVDTVADQLRDLEPVPVLVVTNPVDRLTYRFWSVLDWPRARFIGYSLSEMARAADVVGRKLGEAGQNVHCPIMGEHGEHIVPVFSHARVDGEPVEIPESEYADIREYIRDIPFEIAESRGVQETSRWVTSAGVTRVIRTIAAGENETPICLSTPLAGEYGLRDVCLSVPVTLDENGVAEIHDWELSRSERRELATAYEAVRADVDGM
ncbi:malate dehydrogenase [Halococcus hamelinensis]|uniref:malate dehydrogenase n=1 Tax=Halococcus hamelinensis 100A6 TaxID=1132509 RepID=M0LY29_9EURY|nr:lactate dehydrogenase [Halococcus hamelinensis]EMA37269.1 L-lactate dehydrogenase [Halococcus hamelinensis 100A6]